ncbi:hypothetical protein D3C71_2182720 [compost metagenome]
MKAEISHAPVFAVRSDTPFPINRFGWIQIAGMPEAGFHFDDLAEPVFVYPFNDLLSAGKEGEFG